MIRVTGKNPGPAMCRGGGHGRKPPVRKPVRKPIGGGFSGGKGSGGGGGGKGGCCCQPCKAQTASHDIPVQELAQTDFLDNALY